MLCVCSKGQGAGIPNQTKHDFCVTETVRADKILSVWWKIMITSKCTRERERDPFFFLQKKKKKKLRICLVSKLELV